VAERATRDCRFARLFGSSGIAFLGCQASSANLDDLSDIGRLRRALSEQHLSRATKNGKNSYIAFILSVAIFCAILILIVLLGVTSIAPTFLMATFHDW
jgi:hypothetical protein